MTTKRQTQPSTPQRRWLSTKHVAAAPAEQAAPSRPPKAGRNGWDQDYSGATSSGKNIITGAAAERMVVAAQQRTGRLLAQASIPTRRGAAVSGAGKKPGARGKTGKKG